MLGFPLAMALMTERAFPFALLGHRPRRQPDRAAPADRRSTARRSLRVWAENLRPHHRGRQLDLVTEAARRRRGRLARAQHLPAPRRRRAASARPTGPTARRAPSRLRVWDVPGDIGRRYAAVSGDRNPIHLHPLSARLFGFPTRDRPRDVDVARRALATLDGRLPEAHTSTVEFRAPLRIPGKARLLLVREEREWDLALESPDGEHRHLELSAG